MKVPEKYYDEIFQFAGQWDMPSSCGLKTIHKDSRTYIITTELYQENPGTSITYIECNPNTNSKLSFYDEEMFEVSYEIVEGMPTNLSYRQLSKEEIQSIVE